MRVCAELRTWRILPELRVSITGDENCCQCTKIHHPGIKYAVAQNTGATLEKNNHCIGTTVSCTRKPANENERESSVASQVVNLSGHTARQDKQRKTGWQGWTCTTGKEMFLPLSREWQNHLVTNGAASSTVLLIPPCSTQLKKKLRSKARYWPALVSLWFPRPANSNAVRFLPKTDEPYRKVPAHTIFVDPNKRFWLVARSCRSGRHSL